jgi:hypothetical protein
MLDAKEMIASMPDIPGRKPLPIVSLLAQKNSEALLVELASLANKLEVLFGSVGGELELVKESSNSMVPTINKVGSILEKAELSRSSDSKDIKKLINEVAMLIRKIKLPDVNIPEFPSSMTVKLDSKDKEALSPIPQKDYPTSMSVSNLGSLEAILSEIKSKIEAITIPSETRVSNLSDIKIPEQKELQLDPMVLKYLSRLELLTTDSKNPLSVQLSDGQEFYQAMGGTIATAMGGMKDPTTPYKIADVDDAGTTKYYGFTRADGKWMIMKEVTSSSPKTYRYIAGAENYSTNFTNRASLTYGYFHEVNI